MLLKRLDKAWVDPGPDKGWSWFILFAGWIVNAGTFGITTTGCSGVLYTEFLRVYDVTREQAMWTFSILGITQSIVGGLTSALCHYFSRRFLMVVSSLSCSLAFILCFWSTTFLFTLLAFSILFGSGVGVVSTISGVMVLQYFRKYMTTANGLTLTGAPAAGFILPALLNWLFSVYDLKGAMLIMGGLLLNLVVASQILRPRTARHFPCLDSSVSKTHPLLEKDPGTIKPVVKNVPNTGFVSVLKLYGDLLTEPMFYIVSAHSVFCINHLISLILTLTDYAMDIGFQRSTGVMLVSIFAVSDLFGRVTSGWFADRGFLKKRTIAAINLVVMGAATFALTLSNNIIAMSCFTALIGLMEGSANILINVLYREYVGMRRLTTAISIRLFLNGCVSFSRPFIVGICRDELGSYVNFYYVLSLLTIFGGFLWALEPYFNRKRNTQNLLPPQTM